MALPFELLCGVECLPTNPEKGMRGKLDAEHQQGELSLCAVKLVLMLLQTPVLIAKELSPALSPMEL